MASWKSYIIVGAGEFGSSTVYHLMKQNHNAFTRLIDRTLFPYQNGASWERTKIIRVDHLSEMYLRQALEALEVWWNFLFEQFYHQSGLVMLPDNDLPEEIIED
ncbi:hypothetical protein K402DRAFT_363324 [Aulographum hederae CBS 113979]|uniref:FAD dependent oxidoreductase domain-containing protein n=1 Tax=Aulographum hederae CBS 113979 TaxID=1176131 RepID=A0A6G1GMI0_9PEZI|nr:hypothetical protein K402DRAFT_363324 [Aulographum hederae CBS 113979]